MWSLFPVRVGSIPSQEENTSAPKQKDTRLYLSGLYHLSPFCPHSPSHAGLHPFSQKHHRSISIASKGLMAPCLVQKRVVIHKVSTLMTTGSRLLIAHAEQGLPQLQYPALALFQGFVSTRSTISKLLKAYGFTYNRVPWRHSWHFIEFRVTQDSPHALHRVWNPK